MGSGQWNCEERTVNGLKTFGAKVAWASCPSTWVFKETDGQDARATELCFSVMGSLSLFIARVVGSCMVRYSFCMLFLMKRVLLLLICLFWSAQFLLAASAEFSRYSQIIERRPFAPVTSAEDEAAKNVVTVVAPPAFVKNLRMCAITESPAGIRVGFVNIRIKPPRPYYLYIGEIGDEIELVDADYEKEGALLRKGGEQFWMYMSGGLPATATSSTKAISLKKKSEGFSPAAMRSAKGGSPSPRKRSSGSYAERRQKRLEQMRKRADAARELTDAQVEEKLQNYQMDLIRKGLTPLDIPLTPEMDRQLVEEGVLPAME